MSHLDSLTKHHILLEYSPHDETRSFAALSLRHHIKGGKGTIQRWYSRWDHTPQSLQEKVRCGRPRLLSSTQVAQHVAAPIRNSNCAGRVIRYSKMLRQVQAATDKNISLRTLQRYGKEEAGAKQTRGKKRTATECKYIHIFNLLVLHVLVMYAHLFCSTHFSVTYSVI